MRIIVSCLGKFHAFHLAEQLDKRGFLHKLITPYYSRKRGVLPEFRKDKELIDVNKVEVNIISEIVEKGLKKIPIVKKLANWNYYSIETFDMWARSKIDKCDLFVGWSGGALHSLRKAKSIGSITIIERGSSHILFQKNILEEEYSNYGIRSNPIDNCILEKELQEYEEADYISIPSEFVKQTFIEKGFSHSRLIHVPYGVDISSFAKAAKKDDIFRLIFVGGLAIRKGVHYLLEAFSGLKLRNAELMLIGSLSSEITPFLKKHKGTYNYIGKIPHLELYKYLSQGSVFVLPSIEEGLAMVIPQAMVCGLPIICTTNTGGADIVREGKEGFIIPIRDVEAIKEKILCLYENEGLRKCMSENALKRAKEFTWDIYGEKIIQQYRRVIQ